MADEQTTVPPTAGGGIAAELARQSGDERLANVARFFEIVRRQSSLLRDDRLPFLVAQLDTLIEELRTHAIEYRQYLEYLSELAKRLTHPEVRDYPEGVKTGPQRALFDNLGSNAELAIRLDTAIRGTKKDGWRGNRMKEREVQRAIRRAVDDLLPPVDVDFVFDLVKHQDEY